MAGNEHMSDRESRSQRIIRKHYGLKRQITFQEVQDEIANLRRKYAAGNMNYSDEVLAGALDCLKGVKPATK